MTLDLDIPTVQDNVNREESYNIAKQHITDISQQRMWRLMCVCGHYFIATRASSSVKNIVGQEPNQLLSSGVDDAMPQKEEANVIDKSSAAPRADAHIDGCAPALRLDVRSMGSSSESLDKGRLFSKSSRAWRKLPLVKKLLGKEGKVNCIGDWRKEEEVSHSFIFLDNISNYRVVF